jgi:tetratricopeptide (TPR) repeat protein
MVFAVAGMVFGFVLGYMAANMAEREPAARTAARPSAAPSAPGARPAEAGGPGARREHTPTAPDPDEVRTLEALAKRDKGNAQVRVQLADLNLDHSQFEAAARWYREALGIDPELVGARVDLAAALMNLGRSDDALQELDRVLEKDAAHKKALFNKGLALMQAGRSGEAMVVWESLLKRYPDDPQLAGLKDQLEKMKAGRAGGTS